MLFRNNEGLVIEINKNDYITDVEYYRKISECYNIVFAPKKNNTIEHIFKLSKEGVYNNSNQYNNANRKNITKNHNISHV